MSDEAVTTVCECGKIVHWKLSSVLGAHWKHAWCPLKAANDWPPEIIERLVERERLATN